MSGYRRGAVLGLTIAETFILLTFLLLVAMLGLTQGDEPPPEPDTANPPGVWVRPEEIETLVNAAEEARKAQEEAERTRAAVERERDQAHEEAEEARKAHDEAKRARAAAERERDQAQAEAEQARAAVERERDQAHAEAEEARKAQEEAEQARAVVERERDQAHAEAEEARKAQEEAEQAHAAVERERDHAHEEAEQVRKAQEEAEQTRAAVERERDQARSDLALLRRKGKNPPCWYQIVSAGEGNTREKPYYAFNVAIHEESIELAPRTAPPGGAFDDGGGLYVGEWKRLHIDELPYGKELSDDEFTEAVSDLVAQGRNRQVRTYECVFSVMVWDKTPDYAKKRWKDVHDRIIEGSFSAYTVRDLEW